MSNGQGNDTISSAQLAAAAPDKYSGWSAEDFLKKAEEMRAENNEHGTVSLLREGINRFPKHAGLRYRLGRALYHAMGDTKAAMVQLTIAQSLNPSMRANIQLLRRCFSDLGLKNFVYRDDPRVYVGRRRVPNEARRPKHSK